MNPFSKVEKKFSIIIPVYDTSQFLPTNFQHLSEQDYKNFEVIVVFDGKDKKGEKRMKDIIKKYPKMDIRYITIKHGGAPKARNAGVELATGDIYSFLDADSYLYPGTLRKWANLFELNPDAVRVWGLYDLNKAGVPTHLGGGVPTDSSGKPLYWAFRYSNFCSGTFPVKKEAFVGWDESLKSLQDWDMNLRMLSKDNYSGKGWVYSPEYFFITEMIGNRKGSISSDSWNNWLERRKTVMDKNNIPQSDTCLCSEVAQYHGITHSKILGYEYLLSPQWRPNNYKRIIQVGFFTHPTPLARASYEKFDEFTRPEDLKDRVAERFKGKKIIMWIGTDIYQMRNNASFETLKSRKNTWTKEGWISIVGDKNSQDKLKEIGFDSKIVYYPPKKMYSPLPLPKQVAVGIYAPFNSEHKYHNEHIYELAKKYPKVKFYFYGDESKKGQKDGNIEHLGFIDMDKWMPKFTMHIELTWSGGIGSGGVEYLTAGRQVVTDVDEPYTFKAENTLESIEEAFKSALDKPFDQKEMSDFYRKRHDPKKFKRILDSL